MFQPILIKRRLTGGSKGYSLTVGIIEDVALIQLPDEQHRGIPVTAQEPENNEDED